MNIIGAFEQTIELEQALLVLENHVAREQILVVFMDDEPSQIELTGRTRDIRSNAFEFGMATGTGTSVIGISAGFALAGGPIIWGLLSGIVGFSIGFGLYYFPRKKKARSGLPKKMPEATVIVRCTEYQSDSIKEVLWKHSALTIGTVHDG